jgi:uncharacterized membrane-anchored protein
MKQKLLTIAFAMLMLVVQAQDSLKTQIDSIENSFSYEHGTIQLRNGIGKIVIPPGFKYLNAAQSEKVLVDYWGNPKEADMTMGMILPEDQSVMAESGYVFNVEYNEIGFVKDDDADDINYDDLLKDLQKETEEANAERLKEGYDAITFVGWAAKPFYDKDRKILHWARELKFGSNRKVNTLNYNVRILGRKGVLVLNAIATMQELAAVQRDVPKVLNIVQFSDGFRYKDFDSSIDNVAAWTIGGLVAGKILAKIGFFALFLKFWKLIALAVVAFFSTLWKKIRRKKDGKKEDGPTSPELPAISELPPSPTTPELPPASETL